MLKILHISDFHYKPEAKKSFEEIANRLRESLKDKDFDLVVFSGDLVFEGKERKTFEDAYSILLRPILKDKGLEAERLVIAPGNHDMYRGQEIPAITEVLEKIKNDKGLYEFLENQAQSDLSFKNFEEYNSFIADFKHLDLLHNNFLNVRTVTIGTKNIGIINLNSAWRSKDSEHDRGNILFPVDKLTEGLDKISMCDLKICNLHHSLSDFKDFVEQAIDDKIYDKCDILFSGHAHKDRTTTISSTSIGLLHNRASAVYNHKDPYSKYGYCIVEYNDLEYKSVIRRFRLIDDQYVPLLENVHDIPVDAERRALVDFRKTMRKLERNANLDADNLFVRGRGTLDGKTTFREMFNEPVLRPKSLQECLASRSKGERVSTSAIIQSDKHCIIYGQDKCGKTSLLYKILIDSLHNFFDLKTIPYLINCKELSLSNPLSVVKIMPQYVEMNKKDTSKLFEKYRLLLILDNFNLDDSKLKEWLKIQLSDFPNVRVIVSAEETIKSSNEDKILDSLPLPDHLYFHEITEKEVHQLTVKWPNLTNEKRILVEKRIRQVFTQMHIPFNYWTASLFLWIFEKTDESNIHNNFELVKYYIEELLNRKSILLKDVIRIQYEDLQAFLAQLAFALLKSGNEDYTFSYFELVAFTEKYAEKRKKFTEAPKNVLDFLLHTGTLYQKKKDRFTFRLKGVWEYFLAYQMTVDTSFREDVLKKKEFYLSFGNEIELYAGFRPNDMEFVKNVFENTKIITAPVFSTPQFNEVDNKLIDRLTIQLSASELAKVAEQSKLLEISDEQDELLTVSHPFESKEMETKRYYEKIEANAVNIQKTLFILGRVYRNSLACDHETLGQEILDFVLTGTCNLGFIIHEEFRNEITDDIASKLVDAIASMLPLIMKTYLYDMMCQKSLSRVFEEKLQALLEKPEGNQYRIFLLSTCLLDLDVNTYYKYLYEVDKVLKKGALRYSMLIQAELLYSKEETDKPNTRKSLSEYIHSHLLELKYDKKRAQEKLDELNRRRETRLTTLNSRFNNLP